MNICASCKHWRRFPYHSELSHQHHWGDCGVLPDAENDIVIDCGEGTNVLSVETYETFGCALWVRREE